MAEKQNKRKSTLSIDFLPLIVAYVVLIAFFAIKSPHFFTVKNFLNIALYAANVGILACTMTLVIVAGHIDLSIGSVIALAGVVMGKIMQAGLPVIVAVLACLAVIAGCGVCVVLGGHLIGRRLLELLYGVDLSAYKPHFIVLLIGGSVSAGVYMLYNILIAIRHGGCIKIVYGIVAAVSIAVVRPMIAQGGMMGAALNYLLSCSLLLLSFGAILLAICRREPA